jgi:hypothetical protein
MNQDVMVLLDFHYDLKEHLGNAEIDFPSK